MVRAGTYDQKVIFRSFQSVSDGYGGTTPTWSNTLETFASVRSVRAFDTFEAGQLQLPETFEIRIMYRNSFVPDQTQRILYKGNDLQIKSVRRDGERYKSQYVITATMI